MKKQELIHLHGLLAEVWTYCNDPSEEADELEEYVSLGVRPTSIHKSKTDHKAAVFALADGITRGIRPEETEAPTATAD